MPVTRDRPGRSDRATDDALRGEAVDDRCRVETDDPGNGRSSIGDDDVVAFACRVDPPAKVGSEFRDRNVHVTSVHHATERYVHIATDDLPALEGLKAVPKGPPVFGYRGL